MSHLAQIIALCVAIFASVHARQEDVHEQCVTAGYSGACIEAPAHGIYPNRCSNLMCARPLGNDLYAAQGIGKAKDGTYCGAYTTCRNGRCNGASSLTDAIGKDATFICSGTPGLTTFVNKNAQPAARRPNSNSNSRSRSHS